MHALAIPLHFVVLGKPFLLFLGFFKLLFTLLVALSRGLFFLLAFGAIGITLRAFNRALGRINRFLGLVPGFVQFHDLTGHFISRLILGRIVAAKSR